MAEWPVVYNSNTTVPCIDYSHMAYLMDIAANALDKDYTYDEETRYLWYKTAVDYMALFDSLTTHQP